MTQNILMFQDIYCMYYSMIQMIQRSNKPKFTEIIYTTVAIKITHIWKRFSPIYSAWSGTALNQSSFPGQRRVKLKPVWDSAELKGQCHEIFDLKFFAQKHITGPRTFCDEIRLRSLTFQRTPTVQFIIIHM